jgi:hypothetical protein
MLWTMLVILDVRFESTASIQHTVAIFTGVPFLRHTFT